MVTAVDTSVLLDVLLNDPQHSGPSIAALRQAASEGSLLICETALAEIVPTLAPPDVPQFLSDWNLTFAPSSQPSALLAGEMFRTYLQRDGKRGRVVPDFLIAAHAQHHAQRLLARDRGYWKRCQRECAVYFISRVKEGMVYDWLDDRPLDPHDPRQRGVTADRHIMTRESQPMRIIANTDPATGQAYEFLTNEMDLPAGVIAELYRRRWDVEKVFDQIKNKLGEKKAWGTSLEAKATQGQLVALTPTCC